MKNIKIFYLKILLFLVVKFSIYLNRRVFVMHNRLENGSLGFIATLHKQNEVLYSRLVISRSKGLSEILRDIRTSTYQICRMGKN